MVKKISAVVLALVLCLSVIIIPVNAAGFDSSYTFADGKTSAFKIELDSANYSAGDTVTVNVYAYFADDAAEIKSSYLTFGFSSDVFEIPDKTEIPSTVSAEWDAYWKSDMSAQYAYVTASKIVDAMTAANSAEENANYDTYLKVNAAQDSSKVTDRYHGVVAGDINASEEPLLSFELTLKNDLADGTEIVIGMPTGATVSSPAQTSVTFFTNPGSSTSSKAAAATTYDLSAAVAKATIGAAAAPKVALKFSDVKNQIRFDKTADGKYANTFDGRMVVSIDNLAEVVGADVNLASVQAKIKKIGFLYAKNGAITEAEALTQVKTATAANNYTVTNEAPYSANVTGGGYISTGFAEADYAVTGIIHNIPDADKATAVSAAVYAIYDSNGDGVDEYTVLVLNGGETFTFEDLYSRNFNTAFPA